MRVLQRAARQDTATAGGAAVHSDLLTKPDTGLVRRLLYRLGLVGDIRLWGLSLRVPTHRMTGPWVWRVRSQRYERDEASALLQHVDPGLPLLEIGGGFGAVACIANRALDDKTRHVVVEMDDELVEYLVINRRRNGRGYRVIRAAVAARPVRLESRRDFIGQQATPDGDVEVPVVTLRALAALHGSPVTLFLDVEGMEVDLVDADPGFFQDHVQVLVMELHGHKANALRAAQLPCQLASLGLAPVWTRGNVWVFRNIRDLRRRP